MESWPRVFDGNSSHAFFLFSEGLRGNYRHGCGVVLFFPGTDGCSVGGDCG